MTTHGEEMRELRKRELHQYVVQAHANPNRGSTTVSEEGKRYRDNRRRAEIIEEARALGMSYDEYMREMG